jgi:hypothetical protein
MGRISPHRSSWPSTPALRKGGPAGNIQPLARWRAREKPREAADSRLPTALGGFYPVNDGIYYTACDASGRPRAFCFYSFDTGKSVDIAASPANLDISLTVMPDRTRLAYSTKSQGSEALVKIELK